MTAILSAVTTATGTVTVSPTGYASNGIVNNGANYGPDTAGTVTSGIQEAITFAVNQALAGKPAVKVSLLPGKFTLSTFTNNTFRAVLTADAGYSLTGGQPIALSIEGARPATNLLNGTTFAGGYPLGTTILDCSALDVLAKGLFKQGRVIFAVPYNGTDWPIGAIQLSVSNLVIVLPTYNAIGTGSPVYAMGAGYGNMSLFVNGNTQSSNANHFLFVNGVDAWGATSCEISNVNVVSALAAFNSSGNQFAGGSGVLPLGPAAGFVFPAAPNEGNVVGRRISTFDVPIGSQNAAHLSCDQLYCQFAEIAIYDREAGHGAIYHRINVQETATVVQHSLLTQLTNSVASHVAWDPVGDLYTPISQSFPSSAASSSLIITQASVESPTNVLVDDASNPLTVQMNLEHTGAMAAGAYAGGANLNVNVIDVAGDAQTTLTGTTAGTLVYSQSAPSPWSKTFTGYLNGYENTTASAQTVTFVVPYNHSPAILKDDSGGASVNATTLTLPANMGATKTGYIILEGY